MLRAQDATFEMERRRNRPEKYDRELVHKTVKAMEKITEVGRASAALHYPAFFLGPALACFASNRCVSSWVAPCTSWQAGTAQRVLLSTACQVPDTLTLSLER